MLCYQLRWQRPHCTAITAARLHALGAAPARECSGALLTPDQIINIPPPGAASRSKLTSSRRATRHKYPPARYGPPLAPAGAPCPAPRPASACSAPLCILAARRTSPRGRAADIGNWRGRRRPPRQLAGVWRAAHELLGATRLQQPSLMACDDLI